MLKNIKTQNLKFIVILAYQRWNFPFHFCTIVSKVNKNTKTQKTFIFQSCGEKPIKKEHTI